MAPRTEPETDEIEPDETEESEEFDSGSSPEPNLEPAPASGGKAEAASPTDTDQPPFNLFPPLVGGMSAATIAAAGVFTAYGATGLIVAGVGVGAGLVALAPERSRRRGRGPVGRALSRLGVSRGGGVGSGSGSLARRARAGRGSGGGFGSSRLGSAVGRAARSGSSKRAGSSRAGSTAGRAGLLGSGGGSSRTGVGRSSSSRLGSASRASGVRPSGGGSSRTGSGRSTSSGFGSGLSSSGRGSSRVSRVGSSRGLSGGLGSAGGSSSRRGGLFSPGPGAGRRRPSSPSRPTGGLAGAGWGSWRARRLSDKPIRNANRRSRRLLEALARVRPPMSRWSVRAWRAVVPIRARQWMRRKFRAAFSPRGWWERLRDPLWRWRHGQARPWEASVGRFFKGAWDASVEVFERGDPRKDSYWKSCYGHLRHWEQSLVALVLGSWLVMASPFRRVVVPRMPETVKYPDSDVPEPGGSNGNERPKMSVHEQILEEKAELFAKAIENFCEEAPMMDLRGALPALHEAEGRIATAFANLAKRMRDEMPLNEDFIEGIDVISEGHHDLASTCSELSDSFDISHAPDIQRNEEPRPNEDLWNPNLNRG